MRIGVIGLIPLLFAVFLTTASAANAADNLESWLNTPAQTTLFDGAGYSSPVNDSPATLSSYSGSVDGRGSTLSAIFTTPGAKIVRGDNDKIGQSCALCEGGTTSVYVQFPGESSPRAIPVTDNELGTILALGSVSDTTPSDEFINLFAGMGLGDRLTVAALAAAVMESNGASAEAVDAVRSQIQDGFGLGNPPSSGADQLDVNYLAALAGGDESAITEARHLLIEDIAQELMDAGFSREDALKEATLYVAEGYDSPLLTGNPENSMIGAINSELVTAGEAALLPDTGIDSSDVAAYQDGAANLSGAGTSGTVSEDVFQSAIGGGGSGASDVQASEYVNESVGGVGVGTPSSGGAGSGYSNGSYFDPSLTGGTAPSTGSAGTGSPGTGTGSSSYSQSGFGSDFDWIGQSMLPKTDMMYVTLKRMFGGPVETAYDMLIDSSGKLRNSQTTVQKSSSPATATTFIITAVLFFVLCFSAVIATYMFVYGMYKTAQDQTLMGKEWNPLMVLGRWGVSSYLVLPQSAFAGFSGGQIIVLTVVISGTLLASSAASYAFGFMLERPLIEPIPKQADGFVSSVAKAHACLQMRARYELVDPSSLSSAPYSRVLRGSGTVDSSTLPNVSPSSQDMWTKVMAFFSVVSSGDLSKDPLAGSDDSARKRAIGLAFKESGINPYLYDIQEYLYGLHGECGVIYLPKPVQNRAEGYVPDSDVLRAAGYSHMTARGKIRLSGSAESAQDAAQDLTYVDTGNEIAELLNDTDKAKETWRKQIQNERYDNLTSHFSDLNKSVSSAISNYIQALYVTDDKVSENTRVAVKNIGLLASNLTVAQEQFYNALIQTTITTLQNYDDPSVAKSVAAVQKLGWMSLGTVYWMIERRQTELMNMFDFSDLKASAPRSVEIDSDRLLDLKKSGELEQLYSVIDRSVGQTGVKVVASILKTAEQNGVTDTSTVGHWISDHVAGLLLFSEWFADAENLNVSPIERVRHLGVTVINGYLAAVSGIALVKATFSASEKAAEDVPLAGWMAGIAAFGKSLAGSLGALLQDVSGPLLSGAFICANIIPAMPYIMLLAAAIGYTIYVIEALVGVNFWLLMTGHPDGHDIWGKGSQGWTILLTLFLRPLLIVIGFIAGISFNWVFGHLINITIQPATNIQNGAEGVFGNLSQFAGLLVVYSGLHLFASYKSFSLSWELPNAILRWSGIQDHADLGEREAKDNALAVAVPTGRSSGGMLAGAMGAGNPNKSGGAGGGAGEGAGDAEGGGTSKGGDAGQAGKGIANVNKGQAAPGTGGAKEPSV